MFPAQHLSDEAIAAFADGVLQGTARSRAVNHVSNCAECRHAVNVQRESANVLRTAPLPTMPKSLVDKLRAVPANTPIQSRPIAVSPDGTPVLDTGKHPKYWTPPPVPQHPAQPAAHHGLSPTAATAVFGGVAAPPPGSTPGSGGHPTQSFLGGSFR